MGLVDLWQDPKPNSILPTAFNTEDFVSILDELFVARTRLAN